MLKTIIASKSFKIFSSILVLAIVVVGTTLFIKHSKTEVQSTPEPVVNFTLPYNSIPDNSTGIVVNSYTPTDPKTDPMSFNTFHVISDVLTVKTRDGKDSEKYYYGDKITTNYEGQIMDVGYGTGFFAQDHTGLIIDSMWPLYQRVFSVNEDSYKKLPVEVKYQILAQSATLCGGDTSDAGNIASVFSGDVANVWNGNNCTPKYTMPKSAFIAEHAIAYANLDDNIKTPNHILVVLENTQSYGSNCSGSLMIFSIDADGKYYAKSLNNVYGVCYIDTIAKGTTVQVTKRTLSPTTNMMVETKADFVIPTDSFAVHTDNSGLTYVLYDQTTSTQVKTMNAKGDYYDGGVD